MAGRGGERFEKRQRERTRQEKAQAKRARREERKEQAEEGEAGPTEDELLAAVAALNEDHAEKRIGKEEYETRKAELFEQLGLES
jgi:hypothetical protein